MKRPKHFPIAPIIITTIIMIDFGVNAQDPPQPLEGCNYSHAKNPLVNSFVGWQQFDRIDIYVDPASDAALNACGIKQYPATLEQIEFSLQSFQSDGFTATLDYSLSFSYPASDDDPCPGIDTPFFTTPVLTKSVTGPGIHMVTYKPTQTIVVTKPFFVSIRIGYSSAFYIPSITWDDTPLSKCRQFVSYQNADFVVVVDDFTDWATRLGITAGNIDLNIILSDEIPPDNATPEITFGDDLQDQMIALYDSIDFSGTQYSQARTDRFDEDDSIKTYIDCGFSFPDQYNRFPKPIIKDDIVGIPYTLEYVDEVRGIMAVIRTWTAIDQAGHRSKPFHFIIEYNGETHQVDLSNLKLNNGNPLDEQSDVTVPLGVENTFHVTAQNACADAVLIQWYLNDVLIEGQEGETMKYTWKKPGKYEFKAHGLGVLRKSEDSVIVNIVVEGPQFAITSTNINCFGAATGALELAVIKDVYRWQWSTGSTSVKLQNLKAGAYYVDVWDAIGRSVREEVSLAEPAKLEADIASTDELCEGKCDGTLTASNLRGGMQPYTGYWQNVATKEKYAVLTKSEVCTGQFKFIMLDKNNCVAQDYIREVLKGDPIPIAEFSMIVDPNGTKYTFTNTSKNAVSYSWDMGDGTILTAPDFPTFTYTYKTNGVFDIVLTASSPRECSHSTDRQIEVTSVVGVEDDLGSVGLKVYPNPGVTTITIDNTNGVGIDKVMLSNVQGSELISLDGSVFHKSTVDIDVSHLGQGVYILTIKLDATKYKQHRMLIVH